MFKLSFGIPLNLDEMTLESFEDYCSKLSKIGYKAVEPLINDPSKVCAEAVNNITKKYDLTISGLRSGSIYGKNGWRLSSPDVQNRANAIARLKEVVVLASKLHTGIMVGLMQGHLGSEEKLEDAETKICDALHEVSEYALPYNVTIFFEPVNRFELEFHNTTQSMINQIIRINKGIKNPVKLLPDVYHMHLGDPSIPSAIIRSMPYMDNHIHFADSTRRAPGTGCIDFAEVIKCLEAMDYEGYATVEVTPVPSILDSAVQSAEYLKPLMKDSAY